MPKKLINDRRNSWKWFAVKLFFECVISGEPAPNSIDENYSTNIKTFEESIFLIRAQSFKQAYKLAEKKAKQEEISYYNPYGEMVSWKLVESLDAFELFDEELVSGSELYSRFIRVPKEIENTNVINNFYPETVISEEKQPDYNWMFRNGDFNRGLGSKE